MTMPILGYGEDALTFHALSSGFGDLLKSLDDTSDPAAAIRFFRPSFGRRGTAKGGKPRSEFGEFDAIIGTAQAVYLVEAKWSSSGELRGTDLTLRPEQIRRHKAFRVYLTARRAYPGLSWPAFADAVRPALLAHEIVPPNEGTTLAKNLAFVLDRLSGCGDQIVDVLLFSRMSEKIAVPDRCGEFRVVGHSCESHEKSAFVRLG
jgi:hypothetical protein